MTNEELIKQVNILTRVIGNQSVMLHALKEKVQSIYELRNSSDDFGFQIYEIVDGLKQWADESNQTVKFDFSEFTIVGDDYAPPQITHRICREYVGDAENLTEAIVLAESHVCPTQCNNCGQNVGISNDDTVQRASELAKAHVCPNSNVNLD